MVTSVDPTEDLSLLFRACMNWLGMSMDKSKKGSCFLEEVLQVKQVTSDWRVPPKTDVTKDCDEVWANPEKNS